MEVLYSDKRTQNGSANGFWIVCTEDGRVSVCSEGAADFGIIAGVTEARDLIHKKDIAVFEDMLRIGAAGGEVSAELAATEQTGFSVVKLKGVRLFSSFGVELSFFRNKDEYLASSIASDGRFGRVFSYVDKFTQRLSKVIDVLRDTVDESSTALEYVDMLSSINGRMISDAELITGHLRRTHDPDERVCDIFEMYSLVEKLSTDGSLPYSISYFDTTGGGNIIADTDPERFTGIVMMLAAVSARMSSDNSCAMTLSGNGDFVFLDVECRLQKGFILCGRSCDLGAIYDCIPANPVELMLLECLCDVPEWRLEYVADAGDRLTLRASLVRETNPDRLRFRDCTATVGDSFKAYREYLDTSFSSDPQE